MLDEFVECEAAVRASPRWQAAMRKRGVDRLRACAWSIRGRRATTASRTSEGRRLSRALTWVAPASARQRLRPPGGGRHRRGRPQRDGGARRRGLRRRAAAARGRQLHAGRGRGRAHGPEAARDPPARGAELRASTATRCAGRSGGSASASPRARGWCSTPSRYDDQGRERPVLYRASRRDMVVPYGDPRPTYFRRNAFDVGEYGIGMLANSLELGCDCLGEIRYFDAHDDRQPRRAVTIPNAICLHEEDDGILWKHTDWRTNTPRCAARAGWSSRSSPPWATTSTASTGTSTRTARIQLEVKLTGIISNGAAAAGRGAASRATLVAPQAVRADPPALLQRAAGHEGRRAEQLGLRGQHRRRRARAREPARQRLPRRGDAAGDASPRRSAIIDPLVGRFWKIVNPARTNAWASRSATGWCPGENVLPFAAPEAARDQARRRS